MWRISSCDVAERDALAVGQLARRELGLGDRREADLGAGGRGQFEVAGQEVGVEVGLEHQLDGETGGRGVAHVLVDVAARVDDDGSAGGLVADQVRGLREAVEVVLGELHHATFRLRSSRTPTMSQLSVWLYGSLASTSPMAQVFETAE